MLFANVRMNLENNLRSARDSLSHHKEMPKMDGIAVCQRIRKHVTCPILFLTARIESRDKIIGFQASVDTSQPPSNNS